MRSNRPRPPAFPRALFLVVAACISLPALAVEPGLREKVAGIGANTTGYAMGYATMACHASSSDVAAYTARAKRQYAAAPDFEGEFAKGHAEGAQLAIKALELAAASPDMKLSVAEHCAKSLAKLNALRP